jgi:6-phosphogluconate dehydrogenase
LSRDVWCAAAQGIDKAALVKEVKQALYASKICSYAQGLNIIKAKSAEKDWGIDIGGMARIWKVYASASFMLAVLFDATRALLASAAVLAVAMSSSAQLPQQPSIEHRNDMC